MAPKPRPSGNPSNTPVLEDFILHAAVVEDMNNKDILDIIFQAPSGPGARSPTPMPPLSARTCIGSTKPDEERKSEGEDFFAARMQRLVFR